MVGSPFRSMTRYRSVPSRVTSSASATRRSDELCGLFAEAAESQFGDDRSHHPVDRAARRRLRNLPPLVRTGRERRWPHGDDPVDGDEGRMVVVSGFGDGEPTFPDIEAQDGGAAGREAVEQPRVPDGHRQLVAVEFGCGGDRIGELRSRRRRATRGDQCDRGDPSGSARGHGVCTGASHS